MITPTQIIGVGIRVIGWFKVKIIDIIDFLTNVLGKRTPTWQFKVKWSIEPQILHDGRGHLNSQH